MSKPYISYVDPATIKDAAMLAELERCKSYGTPRPESQAVRAHVPAVFWSFANSWRDVFHTGIADHGIKELCRIQREFCDPVKQPEMDWIAVEPTEIMRAKVTELAAGRISRTSRLSKRLKTNRCSTSAKRPRCC